MLLRLVPEFELRRDVLPWLAERGCAAALGNAPRRAPSLPLSGRLRALPPAEEPDCGEAPGCGSPRDPRAGPQRELWPRGPGRAARQGPLGPPRTLGPPRPLGSPRTLGSRQVPGLERSDPRVPGGLEVGKFAVLKEFLTCRKYFYTSATLHSLFLLPASSHILGFLFFFSPPPCPPRQKKKKNSFSITPSLTLLPFLGGKAPQPERFGVPGKRVLV